MEWWSRQSPQKKLIWVSAGIVGAIFGATSGYVGTLVADWGITDPVPNFVVTCLVYWVPLTLLAFAARPLVRRYCVTLIQTPLADRRVNFKLGHYPTPPPSRVVSLFPE